jgi:hypothetical protein
MVETLQQSPSNRGDVFRIRGLGKLSFISGESFSPPRLLSSAVGIQFVIARPSVGPSTVYIGPQLINWSYMSWSEMANAYIHFQYKYYIFKVVIAFYILCILFLTIAFLNVAYLHVICLHFLGAGRLWLLNFRGTNH